MVFGRVLAATTRLTGNSARLKAGDYSRRQDIDLLNVLGDDLFMDDLVHTVISP